MVRVLAIDPGAVHCGVALFENGECSWASEGTPKSVEYATKSVEYAITTLAYVGGLDVVVIESFRLSPTGAKALVGDALGTVEVIGVVRYLCRLHGLPLVEQQPNIKRATEHILKAKGIALKSRGQGPHAKDAELHGWCYLLRNGATVADNADEG